MALVVETGTGSSTAEAYISVTDADTYWTKHGNPATWFKQQIADKELALRMGAQFLDGEYADLVYGSRTSTTQALAFPRVGLYVDGASTGSGVIPQPLKDSNCEMALEYLSDTTALHPTIEGPGAAGEGTITVGPISVPASFGGGGSEVKTFQKVDALMGRMGFGGNRLVRA